MFSRLPPATVRELARTHACELVGVKLERSGRQIVSRLLKHTSTYPTYLPLGAPLDVFDSPARAELAPHIAPATLCVDTDHANWLRLIVPATEKIDAQIILNHCGWMDFIAAAREHGADLIKVGTFSVQAQNGERVLFIIYHGRPQAHDFLSQVEALGPEARAELATRFRWSFSGVYSVNARDRWVKCLPPVNKP